MEHERGTELVVHFSLLHSSCRKSRGGFELVQLSGVYRVSTGTEVMSIYTSSLTQSSRDKCRISAPLVE